MAEELARKLPPCPVKNCGGGAVALVFLSASKKEGIQAGYHCHACGTLWDSQGHHVGVVVEDGDVEHQ